MMPFLPFGYASLPEAPFCFDANSVDMTESMMQHMIPPNSIEKVDVPLEYQMGQSYGYKQSGKKITDGQTLDVE